MDDTPAAVTLASISTAEFFDGGPPPPSPFPTPTLTARQLRLGLIATGISLVSVSDAIAAISDVTQREIATVEWEYATQYVRSHPLINQIGNTLGLSPDAIDTLWAQAMAL